MKIKKLLSFLLSLCMLFSITAGLDLSAYATTSGDYEYELLDDGTAEIIDYTGSATSLTIPSELDGYTVTSIGGCAFYDCTSLISVTIPDSVTSIGYSAFEDCESLTSVTIPNSVTSIGDEAFRYCTSLTSITIPDSVTSIGEDAFYYCTSLTNISVDTNNKNYSSQDGVLFNKNKTELIQYPIGNTRTSYTIPNGVTSIGRYAFHYCESLTSVTIPNSVTSIGEDAFSGCEGLTNITIPDSVTSIGGSAFYNTGYYNDTDNWVNGVLYINDCLIEADEEVVAGNYNIKPGTRVIGDQAFSSCTSLTSVTIPNSVISIGENAFEYCTSLTSVTIPQSVTSIGNGTFYECESLKSVTIPDGVTSIGSGAFYNTGYYNDTDNWDNGVLYIDNCLIEADCGEISGNYNIKPGTRVMANFAFGWCESLTSVTIPNSVTSIGEGAFSSCTSLTSVTIGNGVTSIGDGAFSGCESLKNVTIPNSVTYIRQVKDGDGWKDTTDDTIGTLDRYTYTDAVGSPISSTAAASKGYKFVGWYDSEGNKVADSMLINNGATISYTTTGDAIYYARFEDAYTLVVSKIDGDKSTEDNKVPLAGAVFTLYQQDDSGTDTIRYNDGESVKSIKCTKISSVTTALSADRTKATAVFQDKLDPEKDYYLAETRAPAGYRLLDTPLKITIDGSGKIASIDGISQSITAKEVNVELANYLTLHMPISGFNITGGWYAAVGLTLLAAAAIGLFGFKMSRLKIKE